MSQSGAQLVNCITLHHNNASGAAPLKILDSRMETFRRSGSGTWLMLGWPMGWATWPTAL